MQRVADLLPDNAKAQENLRIIRVDVQIFTGFTVLTLRRVLGNNILAINRYA
jgi:hypothetical protein